MIFVLIICVAASIGNVFADGRFDLGNITDTTWGFIAACAVGIPLLWSPLNKAGFWKRAVVTLFVPAFLTLAYFDFVGTSFLNLNVNANGWVLLSFMISLLITFWASGDFVFFEPEPDQDPEPEFRLSDNHEGNTAALIAYALKQADRLRRTAYLTLAAVGVLICISVLAVLFAGLITQLDLRSTDALANAQREYDTLLNQKQEAHVLFTRTTSDLKNRLEWKDSPQVTPPPEALAGDLQTSSEIKFRDDDLGRLELTEAELDANIEIAKTEYDRVSELLIDARNRVKTIQIKQAEKAGGTTDLTELNSQSLIASAVTRFGVAALLLFFAQALVNLYRYTLRLSTFYHSRAMILSYSDGNIDQIEKITPHLSADTVPFGKDIQTPIEQVVKVAEVLKN